MAQRGRKPAAAVVIPGRFGKRPEPPPELNARQQEIWREVVSSEPSEFFATAVLLGLLADYCRRREAAENVSRVINTRSTRAWLKSAEGMRRLSALLAMRDLELKGVVLLATKLRLTNQSRYTPQAGGTVARNAPRGPQPWEL